MKPHAGLPFVRVVTLPWPRVSRAERWCPRTVHFSGWVPKEGSETITAGRDDSPACLENWRALFLHPPLRGLGGNPFFSGQGRAGRTALRPYESKTGRRLRLSRLAMRGAVATIEPLRNRSRRVADGALWGGSSGGRGGRISICEGK
ncbi:MAG TPA: hypothetical protein DCZ95_07560 [Verrucomicrobia bacterium]|nr:hypothetical protein [Verrucomicrobiota bacterium]